MSQSLYTKKFGQGKVRSVKNHGISLRTKSGHPVLDKVPRQQFSVMSVSQVFLGCISTKHNLKYWFKCLHKFHVLQQQIRLFTCVYFFKHIVSSFLKILVKCFYFLLHNCREIVARIGIPVVMQYFENCFSIVKKTRNAGRSLYLFNINVHLERREGQARGYKTIFILNSAEHEISTAHKN